MKALSVAAGASLLFALPGCSFMLMHRVPDDYAERPDFTCTTNRAAPGLDVLGSGFLALTGVMWLSLASAFDNQDDVDTIAVIFFAPAALAAASAVVGFSQASGCERAMDDLERRARERRARTSPMSAVGAVAGPAVCAFDTQCGGARLCVANRCVDPPPTPTSTATPPPTAPITVTP